MEKIYSMPTIDTSNCNIVKISEALTIPDFKTIPVLFWDTCSLLDILRSIVPSRNSDEKIISRISDITEAIKQKRLLSVCSEITIQEIIDNVASTFDEHDKEVKKLARGINSYSSFLQQTPFAPASPIPIIDLQQYKLMDYFTAILQTLLDNTLFIKPDDIQSKAHTRLVNKQPPAHLKQEYKDCVIWETCLSLKQGLNNVNMPCYFKSSNTTDYAQNGIFNTDLATEAKKENIIYTSNFHKLYHELNNAGIV